MYLLPVLEGPYQTRVEYTRFVGGSIYDYAFWRILERPCSCYEWSTDGFGYDTEAEAWEACGRVKPQA